ncbi:MAG: hypothetical protein F6K41_39830 [Symploca sp. SIO3E6]|nr:hypothetical protein [Caldora sp. SIO3E6]
MKRLYRIFALYLLLITLEKLGGRRQEAGGEGGGRRFQGGRRLFLPFNWGREALLGSSSETKNDLRMAESFDMNSF